MFLSAVIRPPVWWVKMIPVLICALISLSVAENNDLDTLFPELEHSRTIYVTGEYLYIYIYMCACVCVSLMQRQCRTECRGPLRCVSLSFVHDTHSAVSSVSSVYQLVLPLWLSDNAAMWELVAQRDRVISSGLADENFVWTCQDFKCGEINTAKGKRIICSCHNLNCFS